MKGKAIQQQAQAPKAQAEAQSSPGSDSVDPGSTGSAVRKTSTARNHSKAQRPWHEIPPVPASDIAR